MFISGGESCNAKIVNNCYTINISTITLVPKENMNGIRKCHGLKKMAQKIFAFGGYDDNYNASKSAEVYDVVKNSWKNLPDIAEEGDCITCVRV